LSGRKILGARGVLSVIEYLEQLVEEQQWEKALAYAERLMVSGDRTVRELVVINYSLLTARLLLGEYYGALLAGQLAVKLARDIEDWEYFGKACVNLGVACGRLRMRQEEISSYYEYLAKLPLYRGASRHEAVVWYNLGVALGSAGRSSEAAAALAKALQIANRQGMDRHAHGIRQALVEAYLEMGDMTLIPGILAKCLHYIRNNPDEEDIRQSRHSHFHLRARFAVRTKRFARATSVAQKGLQEVHDNPRYQYDLCIVLAEASSLVGDTREAMRHALTARVCAMRCRRYDLEYEAADLMYKLTQSHPDVFRNLEPGDHRADDPAVYD